MIKSEVKSLDAFLDSKPRGLGPEEKKINYKQLFCGILNVHTCWISYEKSQDEGEALFFTPGERCLGTPIDRALPRQ
jgi:hypothetical protein